VTALGDAATTLPESCDCNASLKEQRRLQPQPPVLA
jgi:hypothetical protein